MDSASGLARRGSARHAPPILLLLVAFVALSLAAPAAAQVPEVGMPDVGMPAVDQALPSEPPALSLDQEALQTSIGGGAAAPAQPVAPVEPVTPGSVPPPAAGGAPAPPVAPAPPAAPAPAVPSTPAPAPVPDAPTHLNLDIRILSPGDNGAKGRSEPFPGLNGNTGASPGVPEDWTWNWDMGGCGADTGSSAAGWSWNWNWGCGDGVEDAANVLEFVSESFPDGPPDLSSPELGLSLPGAQRPDDGARAVRSDSSGGVSPGRGRGGGGPALSAPAFAAPVATVVGEPRGAALVPVSSQDTGPAASRTRADDRATHDGRPSRDPFPLPAPLAASSVAGSGAGGGGGGGALVLVLAALVGALALIPPPPGGSVAALQHRLRSLLSSSRLERPG